MSHTTYARMHARKYTHTHEEMARCLSKHLQKLHDVCLYIQADAVVKGIFAVYLCLSPNKLRFFCGVLEYISCTSRGLEYTSLSLCMACSTYVQKILAESSLLWQSAIPIVTANTERSFQRWIRTHPQNVCWVLVTSCTCALLWIPFWSFVSVRDWWLWLMSELPLFLRRESIHRK